MALADGWQQRSRCRARIERPFSRRGRGPRLAFCDGASGPGGLDTARSTSRFASIQMKLDKNGVPGGTVIDNFTTIGTVIGNFTTIGTQPDSNLKLLPPTRDTVATEYSICRGRAL